MDNLIKNASKHGLDNLSESLAHLIKEKQELFNSDSNKLITQFKEIYQSLPDIKSDEYNLNKEAVSVFTKQDISSENTNKLKESLLKMLPWRKGPFDLFGTYIDSEWNSYLKWKRFCDKIDLKDKIVLDIGSSNGYYLFKAAGKGVKFGLGIEPFIPYYYQFQAVNKYINLDNLSCIPEAFEEVPVIKNFYDTVFLMGVLYHRKSPLDMLYKIRETMKSKGELILENLIIESDQSIALIPEKRYANMNNVYFVPGIKTLKIWLKKAGFTDITCLDISKTDFSEQRKTKWTFDKSLEDFLDPNDQDKTVEGYPAPVRAVIKAIAR